MPGKSASRHLFHLDTVDNKICYAFFQLYLEIVAVVYRMLKVENAVLIVIVIKTGFIKRILAFLGIQFYPEDKIERSGFPVEPVGAPVSFLASRASDYIVFSIFQIFCFEFEASSMTLFLIRFNNN